MSLRWANSPGRKARVVPHPVTTPLVLGIARSPSSFFGRYTVRMKLLSFTSLLSLTRAISPSTKELFLNSLCTRIISGTISCCEVLRFSIGCNLPPLLGTSEQYNSYRCHLDKSFDSVLTMFWLFLTTFWWFSWPIKCESYRKRSNVKVMLAFRQMKTLTLTILAFWLARFNGSHRKVFEKTPKSCHKLTKELYTLVTV